MQLWRCRTGIDALAERFFVQCRQVTYVLLLFMNMADLEPYVSMSEGVRGVLENAVEALERLLVFALLFVDDTETEQDLVGLVKI